VRRPVFPICFKSGALQCDSSPALLAAIQVRCFSAMAALGDATPEVRLAGCAREGCGEQWVPVSVNLGGGDDDLSGGLGF
jgi:hypothetical protein